MRWRQIRRPVEDRFLWPPSVGDGERDGLRAEVHSCKCAVAEEGDGRWRPGPVYRVEISKPSGGLRRLSVPRLDDRVVERASLAVLDPIRDITNCFDRIPRWEVMRRLRDLDDDERVVHLVGLLLGRRVSGGRAAPGDRGRGLHQGSVLAPRDAICTSMCSIGR